MESTIGHEKEIWEWALRTSHPAQPRKGCICHRDICLTSPDHPTWREDIKEFRDSFGMMQGYVAWNWKCPIHGTPVSGDHPDGPSGPVWYEAWWKKMQAEKTQEAA